MEDFPRTIEEFDARFGREEACRAYIESIRWPDGFQCPAVSMSAVPEADLRHRRNDLSRHKKAVDVVVSGDLVRDEPEEWGQCVGIAAGPWDRKL